MPPISQQPPFVHSTPTLFPGGLLQLDCISLRSHRQLSSPVLIAHSHKPSVNITEDSLAPQWVYYTFL
ncbi:hypothetical protein M405DRAFT_808280 [Rhizopogon salebrosus TDB-379]|nr:hypothetical protein M405DRAFT_808280 [Rhizopogon salebrosus TDB-379]